MPRFSQKKETVDGIVYRQVTLSNIEQVLNAPGKYIDVEMD